MIAFIRKPQDYPLPRFCELQELWPFQDLRTRAVEQLKESVMILLWVTILDKRILWMSELMYICFLCHGFPPPPRSRSIFIAFSRLFCVFKLFSPFLAFLAHLLRHMASSWVQNPGLLLWVLCCCLLEQVPSPQVSLCPGAGSGSSPL